MDSTKVGAALPLFEEWVKWNDSQKKQRQTEKRIDEGRVKHIISHEDYSLSLKEAVQKVRLSFYNDCLEGCLNKVETEAGSLKYDDVIKVVQKNDENWRLRDYLVQKVLEVINENRIFEKCYKEHTYRMAVERLRDDVVNEMVARILQETGVLSRTDSTTQDCIAEVETQILADKTTNKDNLLDKAEDGIRNYMKTHNCNVDIKSAVEEIEKDLGDVAFSSQNMTNMIAKRNREKVQENPENKYVRLR